MAWNCLSRHNKFDWNSYVIMQKYFGCLVNKFTHKYSPGWKSIYMEVVTIYHFKILKSSTIHIPLHYHLSDEIDQYDSTTATHICILLQFLLTKGVISPLLTTVWYHTYCCANQYHFAYYIYLLSFLGL